MISERSTNFRLIRDITAVDHPGFAAFKKHMKGRCYGYQALNDAWNHFRIGWDEGAGEQTGRGASHGD